MDQFGGVSRQATFTFTGGGTGNVNLSWSAGVSVGPRHHRFVRHEPGDGDLLGWCASVERPLVHDGLDHLHPSVAIRTNTITGGTLLRCRGCAMPQTLRRPCVGKRASDAYSHARCVRKADIASYRLGRRSWQPVGTSWTKGGRARVTTGDHAVEGLRVGMPVCTRGTQRSLELRKSLASAREHPTATALWKSYALVAEEALGAGSRAQAAGAFPEPRQLELRLAERGRRRLPGRRTPREPAGDAYSSMFCSKLVERQAQNALGSLAPQRGHECIPRLQGGTKTGRQTTSVTKAWGKGRYPLSGA